MREGEIVYTEQLLDEVAKRHGYDRELVEKVYQYSVNRVKEETIKGDYFAFRLPNFGTIYLTLRGVFKIRRYFWDRIKRIVKYELPNPNSGGESWRKIEDHERRILTLWRKIEYYDSVIKRIRGYISELKSIGQKKVAYSERFIDPKHIVNE